MQVVGILGLGAMGGSMADRLAELGFTSIVSDLSAAAVQRAVENGSRAGDVPGDAEIVISSLPNDAAVLSALTGPAFLEADGHGRCLVEMSTILPSTMEKVRDVLAPRGWSVIDAPVSGGPADARNGTLTLLVGAEDAALRPVEKLLGVLGTVEHVGTVGQGKAIKLVNNVMSIGNVVLAAEAFVLGEKLGIEPQRMYDVLSRSGGRSRNFNQRIPRVIERDFASRFSVVLSEKDLRLALSVAHETRYVMPLTAIIHQMCEMAIASGLGGEDIIAVAKLYERWAGLDFTDPGARPSI